MRFFRRFVDAIKKVFGGNKKYQRYVYDAEKLLGVFERAVKDYDSKKIVLMALKQEMRLLNL